MMCEFGNRGHVVKIAAFENDMRERDQRRIIIDCSFERGEIRRDIPIP